MKNLPITWRLNIGLAIFASLSLTATILTWWISKENAFPHQETQRREFKVLQLVDGIWEKQSRREQIVQQQVFDNASASPVAAATELDYSPLPDPFSGGLGEETNLRSDLDKLKRQIYPTLSSVESRLLALSENDSALASQVYLNEYRIARYDVIKAGDAPKTQIEDSLALETKGVATYQAGIKLCLEQGDAGSRDLMERMVVESEESIDWAEAQLDLINMMGLENYLAQQMKKGD